MTGAKTRVGQCDNKARIFPNMRSSCSSRVSFLVSQTRGLFKGTRDKRKKIHYFTCLNSDARPSYRKRRQWSCVRNSRLVNGTGTSSATNNGRNTGSRARHADSDYGTGGNRTGTVATARNQNGRATNRSRGMAANGSTRKYGRKGRTRYASSRTCDSRCYSSLGGRPSRTRAADRRRRRPTATGPATNTGRKRRGGSTDTHNGGSGGCASRVLTHLYR